MVYYLEWSEFPSEQSGFINSFELDTFYPLTDFDEMAGSPLTIEVEYIRDKLEGRTAEKYDAQNDFGTNQEFYVVMPWAKDPSVKFIIAQSDNIEYADGTSVGGGVWLDGVFTSEGGNVKGL